MTRKWDKYEVYSKSGVDGFAGGWEEFVITKNDVVIGHMSTWEDPAVVEDWNPAKDGEVGKTWSKERPSGYRKMRDGCKRDEILDWALDCLVDWS